MSTETAYYFTIWTGEGMYQTQEHTCRRSARAECDELTRELKGEGKRIESVWEETTTIYKD